MIAPPPPPVSNPYRKILIAACAVTSIRRCCVSNPYRKILISVIEAEEWPRRCVSNPYRKILIAGMEDFCAALIAFPILTGRF